MPMPALCFLQSGRQRGIPNSSDSQGKAVGVPAALLVYGLDRPAAGKRRPNTVIRCNVQSCGGALRVGGMIAAESSNWNKELATGC